MIRVAVRSDAPRLDVAFAAPLDGITALWGPSGAGKSSILAAMAGALRQAAVEIVIGGERIDRLPPERRRIGMVHQDARLFPHLSVLNNLRYGLTRATAQRRIGLDAVIDLLGVRHLLARGPATLSGGERQRIALGRALLAQPRLLLLDEPLAALDAPRKAEILPYLEALHDRFALPALYVTHDPDEARRLARHVVLVAEGRIVGEGGPALLPGARHSGRVIGRQADGTLLVRVEGADDFADGAAVMLRPGTLATPTAKEDKSADG